MIHAGQAFGNVSVGELLWPAHEGAAVRAPRTSFVKVQEARAFSRIETGTVTVCVVDRWPMTLAVLRASRRHANAELSSVPASHAGQCSVAQQPRRSGGGAHICSNSMLHGGIRARR